MCHASQNVAKYRSEFDGPQFGMVVDFREKISEENRERRQKKRAPNERVSRNEKEENYHPKNEPNKQKKFEGNFSL